jgi:hypothetical protein
LACAGTGTVPAIVAKLSSGHLGLLSDVIIQALVSIVRKGRDFYVLENKKSLKNMDALSGT